MTLDGLARHVLAGPDKGRVGVVLGTVKDLAIVDRGSPLANPSSPGGDPPVTRAPTMAPPGRFSFTSEASPSQRNPIGGTTATVSGPPFGHVCVAVFSVCFTLRLPRDVKRNKKQPRELALWGRSL